MSASDAGSRTGPTVRRAYGFIGPRLLLFPGSHWLVKVIQSDADAWCCDSNTGIDRVVCRVLSDS